MALSSPQGVVLQCFLFPLPRAGSPRGLRPRERHGKGRRPWRWAVVWAETPGRSSLIRLDSCISCHRIISSSLKLKTLVIGRLRVHLSWHLGAPHRKLYGHPPKCFVDEHLFLVFAYWLESGRLTGKVKFRSKPDGMIDEHGFMVTVQVLHKLVLTTVLAAIENTVSRVILLDS